MRSAIWCALASQCFPTRAQPAQDYSPRYRVDHWTTDNGLPQNIVRSLVQTRDGYLWLTTFDGLVRFDGLRFTVFNRSNTPGLSSNRFTGIIEDKAGTLYAVTEDGGLSVYRDGVFTSYTSGLPGATVADLKLDPQGEAIIKLSDNNSCYLRDGQFIPVPPEYQTSPATDFHISPAGRFWTLDQQGVKRHQAGRVIHYPFAFASLNVNMSVRLYEDRQQRLEPRGCEHQDQRAGAVLSHVVV